MDDDLWKRSRLGHAVEAARGPAQRRSRINTRAHVGRRLRRWRQANDLRQEQPHDRLGLSGLPSRMHLLEHGEIPWTRDDVATVAKVLDMDAAELVREALAAGDPEEPRRRAAFVAWARALPEDEWRAVVDEVKRTR